MLTTINTPTDTNIEVDSDTQARMDALLSFLGLGEAGPDDLGIEESGYADNSFSVDGGEYLVLTDDEADEEVARYIKDSLWAFNASFLAGKTGFDEEVFTALSHRCEDSNAPILSLIKDSCGLDSFVDSAISADGRGHFISFYDGDEGESGDFFIYRTN